VPIDLTPLPKTHKLAIDLRSPITGNSPPNPPSHLQTAINSIKMLTEQYRSTSATGCSRRTSSSSAGLSSQAGFSTSAGSSANASPNHAHHQRQLIKSLALAIRKEKKQMLLQGTMGAPVFGGADVSKFIEVYERLSSCTGTDLVAEDVISTFPYYCLEMLRDTITMIDRYLGKDWEWLKGDLQDTFHN